MKITKKCLIEHLELISGENRQVEEEMVEVDSQEGNILKTEWEKDPFDTQKYRNVSFTLTIIGLN